MDKLDIIDKQGWRAGAPDRPPEDPALFITLTGIQTHPLATGHDNISTAIHNLLTLGLVIQTMPSPTTELAHHIAATLLNFSVRHGVPSPYQFMLQISGISSIPIPPRSHLCLLYLSHLLRINIFVFSSRAKPKSFLYPESDSSIAFFHRIDRCFGTSEYIVVAPSSRIPNLPAPLPAPPYVFTSPVGPATFRVDARKTQTRISADAVVPDIDTCKEVLTRVW